MAFDDKMGHGHQHRPLLLQGHGPRHDPEQQHDQDFTMGLRWEFRLFLTTLAPPVPPVFTALNLFCFSFSPICPLSTAYLHIVGVPRAGRSLGASSAVLVLKWGLGCRVRQSIAMQVVDFKANLGTGL